MSGFAPRTSRLPAHAQWPRACPYSITVAGAAPAWAFRLHRLPVSPPAVAGDTCCLLAPAWGRRAFVLYHTNRRQVDRPGISSRIIGVLGEIRASRRSNLEACRTGIRMPVTASGKLTKINEGCGNY